MITIEEVNYRDLAYETANRGGDIGALIDVAAQAQRELDAARQERDRLGARELAWPAYEDYYVRELANGFAPETFSEWYASDLS
jgi:hypothetical protein